MERERTLFLVKPDAVQRGLAGEIIKRLENRGLKIVGLKLMQVPKATAEKHYGEHKGKPFYNGLVEFITSAPVVAAVFEGTNAIEIVRATNGLTNPAAAAPGSDTFDPSSNLLTLGSVVFLGTTYNNVRVQLNSFTLLAATPMATTPVTPPRRSSDSRPDGCLHRARQTCGCAGSAISVSHCIQLFRCGHY